MLGPPAAAIFDRLPPRDQGLQRAARGARTTLVREIVRG